MRYFSMERAAHYCDIAYLPEMILMRGQTGMSAVPCGIRGDFVNSTVLGCLDHGDSKTLGGTVRKSRRPREIGP